MESIDALAKKLSSYLEPSELKQVKEAFMFASEAHTGQFRSSGDPYVSHPLAVANILSNFKMDQDSISAAILHDVMEDSGTPKHVIQNKFNTIQSNLFGKCKLLCPIFHRMRLVLV